MPLTQKIIEDVIRKVIVSELTGVNAKLHTISSDVSVVKEDLKKLSKKVSNLSDTVTSFSADVQKFDQEQTILSSQIPNRTDRIEKLEKIVFGSIQA